MATTLVLTGIQFPDSTTQTTAAAGGFPSGTVMLFAQTTAPVGWTKSVTHNDKALRIVSGTASSGGSVAFTTAFSAVSIGATTLTVAQMPSHTHTVSVPNTQDGYGLLRSGAVVGYTTAVGTSAAGSNASHTHSIPSFAVQYVDVIIASKD